ncbi:MAG: efflux RND transporter periplasmic adaptor subunit [Pseudomonadota bacterium]
MPKRLSNPARSRLALALVGAALPVLACNSGSEPKAEAARSQEAPREVVVEKAVEMPIERAVEVSGTLAAHEQVVLAAKVAGRVAELFVDLASPVKAGDVVARLETADYALRVQQAQAALAAARAQLGVPPRATRIDANDTAIVRQARASLEEARANLERSRALAKEGLITAAQLETAEAEAVRAETALQSALEEVRIREAAVGQRRSELEIARQQLADTEIRSPITGVVQARLASIGEYVAAGAPIAEIVRIDPLRLRLPVPERDAALLRGGERVEVRVDGDGTVYTGKLTRLAPALDARSRSLLVEADIQNPGTLRPGAFARARIIVGERAGLTIPKSAVVTFAGLTKAIVVENGRAVEKVITLGASAGDRVEVVQGLRANDAVVVKPGSLQQGQPVRVRGSLGEQPAN